MSQRGAGRRRTASRSPWSHTRRILDGLPRRPCKQPLPVGRRANPQNVRSPRLPSRRDRKASDTGITNDERGNGTEAAELSRRVQAKLTQMGRVGQPQAVLSDGNHAGIGDLIRARLNTEIDAGGRKLTNRDFLTVAALHRYEAEVQRQRPDGTWTGNFQVPRSYLAHNAELAYAGNVHVAQGRTVDTAHLLVTDSLSRQALYVGLTRGRESNTAHVVTGKTAPPGREPYQQAAPESVIRDVMQRDGGDLSATGQIRQAQEWAGGTGHLVNQWSAATRTSLYPDLDRQIKARLTEPEGWRYEREHSRQVLRHKLREAQLAGHDVGQIVQRITADSLDGARSISSVLHGRLQRLQLPAHHEAPSWAQRTPATAPPLARELAAGLDERHRELGERALENPEPWLTRHLGPVPGPDASTVLRDDYARRAGTAAAYREARGITDRGRRSVSTRIPNRSSKPCAGIPSRHWRSATNKPSSRPCRAATLKPA